jgi:hypothetical protein
MDNEMWFLSMMAFFLQANGNAGRVPSKNDVMNNSAIFRTEMNSSACSNPFGSSDSVLEIL